MKMIMRGNAKMRLMIDVPNPDKLSFDQLKDRIHLLLRGKYDAAAEDVNNEITEEWVDELWESFADSFQMARLLLCEACLMQVLRDTFPPTLIIKWPDGRITEDRASLYQLASFIEGRSHPKGSELIGFHLANGAALGLWSTAMVDWVPMCATHAVLKLEADARKGIRQ